METSNQESNSSDNLNSCLRCSTCCGFFRVLFYWAEADDGGGLTPAGLTEPITPFIRCMQGTNSKTHCRCAGLEGEIGQAVSCNIYSQRPSPYREFLRSGENGEEDDACNRAKTRYGLPPL